MGITFSASLFGRDGGTEDDVVKIYLSFRFHAVVEPFKKFKSLSVSLLVEDQDPLSGSKKMVRRFKYWKISTYCCEDSSLNHFVATLILSAV